ncbi:MAG: formylglycine-generating enzyme family protein [Okeania sp. SIO2D1]|nr:formylglycine-generating enzyme family protein [Okeania sp. SIO2D1]
MSESDWVWRYYLKSSLSDGVGEILDKMIVAGTKKRFKNVGEILSLILPNSQREIQSTVPSQISQPSIIPPTNQLQKQFTSPPEISKSSMPCVFSSTKSEEGELFTFEVLTVDNSGYITNRTQRSARQKIEDLGNGIKLEMVYIPGGSFLMGSPENEKERNKNESPQHKVTIEPFYMSKYPITQEQYLVIMGKNPSRFKGKKLFRKDSEGGKRPVENVRWLDATEFCQKLSIKTGKAYILPSESQWEYACRAGTTTPFYFGSSITPSLVNYNSKSTCDVGSFPPNAFGLYDMHGNVWEWCQDIWHDNYNGAPTNGSPWETPEKGFFKSIFGVGQVLRGGCWINDSRDCRCARRYDGNADDHNGFVGFRVVLPVSRS